MTRPDKCSESLWASPAGNTSKLKQVYIIIATQYNGKTCLCMHTALQPCTAT